MCIVVYAVNPLEFARKKRKPVKHLITVYVYIERR